MHLKVVVQQGRCLMQNSNLLMYTAEDVITKIEVAFDYDPKAESSVFFFIQVQNKMQWAANKRTAEISKS
jgi:hypothetical protein